MTDPAFVNNDDLIEIYFTAKETFTPADYAALGVVLASNFSEEFKTDTIKNLLQQAFDRYVEVNGREPFPPLDYSAI